VDIEIRDKTTFDENKKEETTKNKISKGKEIGKKEIF